MNQETRPPVDTSLPKRNWSKPFVLMLLPAALALGTMVAIMHGSSPDPRLDEPYYQGFLFLCIAVISLALGRWLGKEAGRTRHPAIGFVSAGFYGQALLFGAEALIVPFLGGRFGAAWNDEAAQQWFTVISAQWVVMCSLTGTLALTWRRFRHWLRDTSGDPARSSTRMAWVCFAVYLGAGIWAAGAYHQNPPVWASLIVAIVLGSGVLMGGIRFYFERHRPIVLPFMGGLLIFLLSQLAIVLSGPWHLLWWTGHLFFFSAWMLVGYGVLEGHRVFEREELINRLAELTSLLEEQSVRDPLTAIFNRRHAMAILEMEFKKAQRGKSPLTLLVGDLDDFKLVNDTYGHLVGDQVLRETAHRLGENVRESDVVSRCGGEEFWIILPLTNRIGGREVATKMLEALRNYPFETESAQLTVTMSMGVADTFSPSVTDVASLIREADRALYTAKRAGKDRVAILDPLAFTVPASE